MKALFLHIVSAQEILAAISNNYRKNNNITTLNTLNLLYVPEDAEGLVSVVIDIML